MLRIIIVLGTTFFFVSCTQKTYPETGNSNSTNTSVEAGNANSGQNVPGNKVNISESVSSKSEDGRAGEQMAGATTNSDE